MEEEPGICKYALDENMICPVLTTLRQYLPKGHTVEKINKYLPCFDFKKKDGEECEGYKFCTELSKSKKDMIEILEMVEEKLGKD